MKNNESKNINIRKAIQSDVQNIYCIEKDCFSVPWSQESILSSIKNENSYFVVAESESSNILGYSGLYFVMKECYVYNIGVKKEYRHKGIGKRLINSLIKFCSENTMEFLSLEVRKSNIGAVRLYQNAGFNVVGTRKNFYSNPKEDALIMTLFFN